MHLSARCTAGFMAVFILTGCAADDLLVKRQSEADAKIEHLIQAGKKGEQRLNELSAQIQRMDDRERETVDQIKQLHTLLQDMRISQEDVKARLTLLTQQAATPKIEVVNPEPPVKNRDHGPPFDYLKAFGLYSANKFVAAIDAFELFLKNNPQSDYAANALYWIGECHYSMADFPNALSTFQKMMNNYPKSTKFPDALLKTGYTYSALKEKEKSVAAFERLIKSYPGSPAASKAREKLTGN
jgi:tol-pal system protein YbgF